MGLGVGGAGGDHAVQLDGDLAAFGINLVGVPAACGVVFAVHRGDVDQAARGVVLRRVLVPDLHFECTRSGIHHLDVRRAQIDAAVGAVFRPELGIDLDVAVILLGDQHARAGAGGDLVSDDGAAFTAPVGGRAGDREVVHAVAAVDQRCPALGRCHGTAAGERKGDGQHRQCVSEFLFHYVLPHWLNCRRQHERAPMGPSSRGQDHRKRGQSFTAQSEN